MWKSRSKKARFGGWGRWVSYSDDNNIHKLHNSSYNLNLSHEQKSGTSFYIQYPLHLLKLGEGSNIMVELKSGETYNGVIKGVDKFTNIKMEAAVLTDKVWFS